MLDGLQEILFTLRQNKLRTVLTAFGVFWGIFMLVLLLGAGRGMQNGSTRTSVRTCWTSSSCGPAIPVSRTTAWARAGRSSCHEADIDALKQQVPGIRLISAERFVENGTVTYERKNSNGQILGVPDEYFRVKGRRAFQLRTSHQPAGLEESRKVVAIGTKVAERLFDKGVDPIGKDIRVKDVVMKVTGVFYDKGDREQNSNACSCR
jgi:putative ABC transport system permease protein